MTRPYDLPEKRQDESDYEWIRRAAETIHAEALFHQLISYLTVHEGYLTTCVFVSEFSGLATEISMAIVERFSQDRSPADSELQRLAAELVKVTRERDAAIDSRIFDNRCDGPDRFTVRLNNGHVETCPTKDEARAIVQREIEAKARSAELPMRRPDDESTF